MQRNNLAPATNPDHSIPTRHSLVERLHNLDDQDSWQDFFDTYWRLIYGVAMKARLTEAEAQDVVQETVISVAKSIGEYKTDPIFGSFKSWLLLITRRRIADQFRKRPRLQIAEPASSDGTTETAALNRHPDPASLDWTAVWDEQWEKNLMEVAIERAKAHATPKDYVLFYQHVVKDLPAEKVAGQYRVGRAQVYVAKYRVSRLIKKEVRLLKAKKY